MRSLALLLVTLAAMGCKGSSPPDSPRDGAPDGSADARVDAHTDASSDAQSIVDAAVEDVRPDAWESDADGGWALAPWNPPGCEMLQALSPSTALPPMTWHQCPGGLAGCLYFDTDAFVAFDSQTPKGKLGAGVHVTNAAGMTRFVLSVGLGPGMTALAVYELPAGPVAYWKENDTSQDCRLTGFDVNGSQLAVEVLRLSGGGSRVVFGEMNDLLAGTGPLLDLNKSTVGSDVMVHDVTWSQQVMALGVNIAPKVYTWTFGSQPPQLIQEPMTISEDLVSAVVGGNVLLERDGTPEARGIWVRTPDGAVTPLYQKPSVYIGHVASDGKDILWQESVTDDGGEHCELWTAPWTTDPASFTPHELRKLGDLGWYHAFFFAEGWYVVTEGDAILRAVRASDGAYVEAAPPDGYGWIRPWGVLNGEIWVTLHQQPGGLGVVNTVARVPIASMGVPKP